MFARDIMTESPQTIDLNRSMQDALMALASQNIRHLPIVEDDKLVGMLSDRDLRDYNEPVKVILRKKVKEMMQGSVLTTTADTPGQSHARP